MRMSLGRDFELTPTAASTDMVSCRYLITLSFQVAVEDEGDAESLVIEASNDGVTWTEVSTVVEVAEPGTYFVSYADIGYRWARLTAKFGETPTDPIELTSVIAAGQELDNT